MASIPNIVSSLSEKSNYEASKLLLDAIMLSQKGCACNIAHIETPNYKRVELDPNFEKQLSRALKKDSAQSIQNFKLNLIEDKKTPPLRADGNNVSLDEELLRLSDNALKYELFTQYVSNSLKQIKTATTGKVVV